MYGKRGPLNPRWNPNRDEKERERDRHYYEYEEFRIAVFERDDYTCQCCGKRGTTLRAHHLHPYSKYEDLRLVANNAITLCADCHDPDSECGYHKLYGTRNNTASEFWGYFKNRQKQLGIDNWNKEVDRDTLMLV